MNIEMRHTKYRDRGIVSAFVVCLVATFVVAAGLAVDSGRLVASRITIADHAENAARVAAQQASGLRSGERILDPDRARRAALEYLARFGLEGEVIVDARSVVVSAETTEKMTLLRLVGIESRIVAATRRAELADR